MRALVWHGIGDIRAETTDDPSIENDHDAIIKVTATAICGSDLHLVNGVVPEMHEGDILGHEFMGEIVETGSAVRKMKVGDRVVVPFTIACGDCFFCDRDLYSLCDNSNRKPEVARQALGHATAGLFGYSHLTGGFAGGQAEYVRVPYADVGPIRIDSDLRDDQVLFLSDIFPTGYMAAENCAIEDGDTVAIWGCGPVGQFAIRSAFMLGAGRVIAIDCVPERLALARDFGGAETIDFSSEDVLERLAEMTGGRGPDRCIDAVGAEAHGHGDKPAVTPEGASKPGDKPDHPDVLAQAIMACRKGGTLSVPGVYAKTVELPFGALMNKGLALRSGQTHVQRYLAPLLKRIENADIDPSAIITHRAGLDEGPELYKAFSEKRDGCIKVFLTP
ncbi:zinc-dependent alcohol dehydrogenase [Microbulbifer yueqingensis]|uniref:Threonine dehydrogenase n=1 Tax=Microbulbifer yueqingensis TaxID=658219 RepID=A0A1G8UL06_9GAMM|nr:zinc-dependent alcohol dehydrogenase [Microbulbifer yueqingensis]SDJ54177.1 Threonine dehydrogenase [Microbulbifer yueqingensis]